MCSIAANATADGQLTSLKSSGGENLIEGKLRDFAGESNVQQSGILDSPANHLHGLPPDLKHIRRLRAGRHRVFYTGYHTLCSYQIFFVKKFKDKGKSDELDPAFHSLLRRALRDTASVRKIRPPDETDS